MSSVLEAAKAELERRKSGGALAAAKAELAKRKGTGSPSVNTDIPPEMVFDPRTGGYMDASIAAQRMPAISKAAAVAAQGMPFVGEYFDEAVGKVSGAVGAEQIAREAQTQFKKENPKSSMALQVGTGIASAAPLAMGGAVMKGTGLAQKALVGAGTGAAVGATEGAVSGYGAGNEGNRAESAQQRAIVGGALGGIVGAAAPMVTKGAQSAVEWFGNRRIADAAKELGVSPDVARVIRSISQATDDVEAQKIFDQMGGEAFFADISPAARNVLDTVMASTGQGGQIAGKAISERAASTGARLSSVLDETMGSPSGMSSASKAVRGSVQGVDDAYTAAYNSAIDYSAPTGRRIEEIVSKLPKKTAAQAIESANDQIRYEGGAATQILADIAEDGTVTFKEMPSVAQLDFIKRAYDDIRRNGTDPVTGKLTSDARFAGRVAKDIRDATKAASPEYRAALGLASDRASREEALEIGAGLFSPKFTREMAADAFRGMSKPEKQAAAMGARSAIDEAMANVKRTVSDPDVDARQVQKLLGDLSSDASRKKLVTLLGGQKARAVIDEIDQASIALNLKAATISNSRTFGREITKEAIDSMGTTSSGVYAKLKSGSPMQAGSEFIKAATGMTDEAIALRQQGLYADIASALVDIKGPKAEKALKLMRNIDVQEPITKARAEAIEKALRPVFVQMQQQPTRSATE